MGKLNFLVNYYEKVKENRERVKFKIRLYVVSHQRKKCKQPHTTQGCFTKWMTTWMTWERKAFILQLVLDEVRLVTILLSSVFFFDPTCTRGKVTSE